MDGLPGRTAIVPGGSRGIGEAAVVDLDAVAIVAARDEAGAKRGVTDPSVRPRAVV